MAGHCDLVGFFLFREHRPGKSLNGNQPNFVACSEVSRLWNGHPTLRGPSPITWDPKPAYLRVILGRHRDLSANIFATKLAIQKKKTTFQTVNLPTILPKNLIHFGQKQLRSCRGLSPHLWIIRTYLAECAHGGHRTVLNRSLLCFRVSQTDTVVKLLKSRCCNSTLPSIPFFPSLSLSSILFLSLPSHRSTPLKSS